MSEAEAQAGSDADGDLDDDEMNQGDTDTELLDPPGTDAAPFNGDHDDDEDDEDRALFNTTFTGGTCYLFTYAEHTDCVYVQDCLTRSSMVTCTTEMQVAQKITMTPRVQRIPTCSILTILLIMYVFFFFLFSTDH